MKLNNGNLRRGFTLVELLVVISIIVVLAGLAVPAAIGGLKKAAQMQGISNAGGIKKSLDLFAGDFDNDYPNDVTAEQLADLKNEDVSGGSGGGRSPLRTSPLRTSSLNSQSGSSSGSDSGNFKPANFYYSQIMSNNSLGTGEEELFFNNEFKKAFALKKPNKDGELTKGECVWGYTVGLQQTSSSHLPVVFDCPVASGDSPRFSKRVWGGKVIVARLNNSTKALKIAGEDKISGIVKDKISGDNVNIFAPEYLEEGTLVLADLKQVGKGASNN